MKKNLVFIAVITTTILASCGSPKKAFDNNSNGWLPSNFNPKIGVLLIETTWPKNQQAKIETFMKEKYPYKYEFVTAKDLENNQSKYLDRKTYLFALVNSWSSHTIHEMQSNRMNVVASDYNFIDLVNNKDYPKSGIASSWSSMVLKAIIIKVLKDKT